MRVLIMSDMEGVSGIVVWDQVNGGAPLYEEGRRLYTEEINAALCGHYGCPIALVTGDEATARETRALLGDGLLTVAVKRGLTRYSARQIPPVRARQMIEAGAQEALRNLARLKPYIPAQPTTIAIDLGTVDSADQFRGRHGVEIVEPLKVVSRGENWLQAWNQVWHW